MKRSLLLEIREATQLFRDNIHGTRMFLYRLDFNNQLSLARRKSRTQHESEIKKDTRSRDFNSEYHIPTSCLYILISILYANIIRLA